MRLLVHLVRCTRFHMSILASYYNQVASVEFLFVVFVIILKLSISFMVNYSRLAALILIYISLCILFSSLILTHKYLKLSTYLKWLKWYKLKICSIYNTLRQFLIYVKSHLFNRVHQTVRKLSSVLNFKINIRVTNLYNFHQFFGYSKVPLFCPRLSPLHTIVSLLKINKGHTQNFIMFIISPHNLTYSKDVVCYQVPSHTNLHNRLKCQNSMTIFWEITEKTPIINFTEILYLLFYVSLKKKQSKKLFV